MDSERLQLETDGDVNEMRERLRESAEACGFKEYESTKLVTAASEISRNVLDYAEAGEINIETVTGDDPHVRVKIEDSGPGIENINRAMEDGYSGDKSNGLGVGLPGAKRLADEFDITSTPGEGTTVTFSVRKDDRR